MRRISVTMNISLDGVVQGLGRPDEDTRDGFAQGGWGLRHQDDDLAREMGAGMAEPGDLLLGRRTWTDFAGFWPHQPDNPVTRHLNATTKYVPSRTLSDVDSWSNSVLLAGDAVETVRALKADGDRAVHIVGSAALVRSLHVARLIDAYQFVVHPLTLGAGARLFDKGMPPTDFALERCVPTSAGVVIASYRRIAA
ncbi:dihydrofolate reductase family protein [Jatrophihabitans sp. YIM 134969]